MDGGLDVGGSNDSQFVGIRKEGSYCKTHIIILGEMQPPLFEGRWGIYFFFLAKRRMAIGELQEE